MPYVFVWEDGIRGTEAFPVREQTAELYQFNHPTFEAGI